MGDIFPGKKIVLVMDNLNIHSPASLYEAFEPAEARRIAACPEIHFTPRRDSWPNLAEIETGRHGPAVSGTAHFRPGATLPRNQRLAGEAQSRKRIRRMEIQDSRCSHQAEVAVSVDPMTPEHWSIYQVLSDKPLINADTFMAVDFGRGRYAHIEASATSAANLDLYVRRWCGREFRPDGR